MSESCCEEPPVAMVPSLLDIYCQVLGPNGRCGIRACIYVHYPAFEVDLALCGEHLHSLPKMMVPLVNVSRADAERLYKEARQFDDWVKELNDAKRTVPRDAGAVAAAPDHVPPIGRE